MNDSTNKTFIKLLYDSIVEFESYNIVSTNIKRKEYNNAKKKIKGIKTSDANEVISQLESLEGYLDSNELIQSVYENLDKLKMYEDYVAYFKEQKYYLAYTGFITLNDFADANGYALICMQKMELIYKENNLAASKIKLSNVNELINNLESIKGYLDSENLINYYKAIGLFLEKKYVLAKESFKSIADYKNSNLYIQKCDDAVENIYSECCDLKIEELDSKNIRKAIEKLTQISFYKNTLEIINKYSLQLAETLKLEQAYEMYSNGDIKEVIELTKDAKNKKMIKIHQDALQVIKALEYSNNQQYDEALKLINILPETSFFNSLRMLIDKKLLIYKKNNFDPKTKTDKELLHSIEALKEIINYKDVKSIIKSYEKDLQSFRRKIINFIRKIGNLLSRFIDYIIGHWQVTLIIFMSLVVIFFVSARIKVAMDKAREESVHRVTYVLNGGEDKYLDHEYVTKNGLYLTSSEVEKPYHIFCGWYFDAEFTKPIFDSLYWDDGTYFKDTTNDYTVYAKWKPREYKLDYAFYDIASGSWFNDTYNPNPSTITYKDINKKIVIPQIAGYRFVKINGAYQYLGDCISKYSDFSYRINFRYFKIPTNTLNIANIKHIDFDNFNKKEFIDSYNFIPSETKNYSFYIDGNVVGSRYCDVKVYDNEFNLVSEEFTGVYNLSSNKKYYICLFNNSYNYYSQLEGIHSFFVVPDDTHHNAISMLVNEKYVNLEASPGQRISIDADSYSHTYWENYRRVDIKNFNSITFDVVGKTGMYSRYKIEIFDQNLKRILYLDEYFTGVGSDGIIRNLDVSNYDHIYIMVEVNNRTSNSIDFGVSFN